MYHPRPLPAVRFFAPAAISGFGHFLGCGSAASSPGCGGARQALAPGVQQRKGRIMAAHDALRTILPVAGLAEDRARAVEFTGGADPVLPTPFRIGETAAAA